MLRVPYLKCDWQALKGVMTRQLNGPIAAHFAFKTRRVAGGGGRRVLVADALQALLQIRLGGVCMDRRV